MIRPSLCQSIWMPVRVARNAGGRLPHVHPGVRGGDLPARRHEVFFSHLHEDLHCRLRECAVVVGKKGLVYGKCLHRDIAVDIWILMVHVLRVEDVLSRNIGPNLPIDQGPVRNVSGDRRLASFSPSDQR